MSCNTCGLTITPEASATDLFRTVTSQRHYTYQRVGLDERTLEFLPEGKIGVGRGGLEDHWTIRDGKLVVGTGKQVCFEATPDPTTPGSFIGKWKHHEQCGVVLTPAGQFEEEEVKPAHRTFHFRSGTNDRNVFTDVVFNNEYDLPDNLEGQVVVDIGAHIGSFTFAAWKRGAKAIYSYEANKENFESLVKHMGDQPNVHLRNLAVWRSGVEGQKVKQDSFPRGGGIYNTGGASVHAAADGTIETVSLDSILKALGHVDLLKIDCEGSEFPILYTSQELSRVSRIVGEYHTGASQYPLKPSTYEALKEFLEIQGFVVSRKSSRPIDQFWAERGN